MKIIKLSLVLIISVSLCFILTKHKAYASDSNYSVNSFEAEYSLQQDENLIPKMKIKERIVVEFKYNDRNHGIIRSIPASYKKYQLNTKIQSVTDDYGKPYKYDIDTTNDNITIKIGDPDKFVSGSLVYNIEYKLDNVISFEDNADEFYWDINGNQWENSIGYVTAKIYLDDSLYSNLKKDKHCFTGQYGSKNSNCIISEENKLITVSSTRSLMSEETLSFVMAFDKGTFKPDQKSQKNSALRLITMIIEAISIPIVTFIFMFYAWKKYGKDPSGKGVIIPQYDVPKEMNVLLADTVLNETVRPVAIPASIIELAIAGYIHIYETGEATGKKQYELELVEPRHESEQLQMIINMLFGDDAKKEQRIRVESGKNFIDKIEDVQKKSITDATSRGYFAEHPTKATSRYRIPQYVALCLGGVLAYTGISTGIGIGLLIAGIIIVFGRGVLPSRTKSGVETRDHLLGLRDYIKLAETDRIKYLQSPTGAEKYDLNGEAKVKIFEKLLPYAMLFELENEWAKEFQGIYQQPPSWYSGNWSDFSTISLASSINSFSSTSVGSFSSESGFSDMGGFSGGGGGGGGGSAW
jgi:uncharacterized membrane protein YgcG